jgi:hypothetical protein
MVITAPLLKRLVECEDCKCAMANEPDDMRVHYTLYTIHYTLYTIHYTLHYTLYEGTRCA